MELCNIKSSGYEVTAFIMLNAKLPQWIKQKTENENFMSVPLVVSYWAPLWYVLA
jgi:hypothetical protein